MSLFCRRAGLSLFLLCLLAPASPAGAQWDQAALVAVDAVQREEISATQPVIGRLVPRRAGDVAALVSGPLVEMQADVGDRVTFRQALGQISLDRLEIEQALAEANLAEAVADVKTEEARLMQSQQELSRMEGLRDSSAFSPGRLEDLTSQRDQAQAELLAARAREDQRRADLALVELAIDRSSVRAPYDGIITRRYKERGDWANAGEAVYRLLDDKTLEAEVDIPLRLLAGLQPEGHFYAELDDGTALTLTLRAVIPDENPLTRTRAARFSLDEVTQALSLAANQSIRLFLPTDSARTALTLHKDGVLLRPHGVEAYIMQDGQAVLRTIRIGTAQNSRFEVLEGLEEGELVVIRGNEGLFPGQNLRTGEESPLPDTESGSE